jgi:hypothetical protein
MRNGTSPSRPRPAFLLVAVVAAACGQPGDAELTSQDALTAGLQWTSIGPTWPLASGSLAGKINAFVVDPTNPNVMLIAGGEDGPVTSSGIWRTTNGGASWKPAMAGLVDSNGRTIGTVQSLWMDPAAPSVVVAATPDGIFRSASGARSWSLADGDAGVTRLAALGTTVFANSAAGILASTDDGANWSLQLATADSVTAIAASTDVAYAAARDGSIYAFGQQSWSKVGRISGVVHMLAIDPFDTQRIYASLSGSRSDRLYASMDGGASWGSVEWTGAGNLPRGQQVKVGPQAIAFSSTIPHRLYVAGDGEAIWTAGDGNAGPTYAPAAIGHDVRDLYMFPNAAGTDDRCFAATDQGLEVADACSARGSGMTMLGGGLSTALVNDFAVSPDGSTVVATLQDYEPTTSVDRAASWTFVPGVVEDGYAAINPADPSQCYLFRTALFTSSDGCRTFTQTGDFATPPMGDAADVFAFDPSKASTVYVVASGTASVEQSTDGGATWNPIWPGFQAPDRIAISPTNAKHILVDDGGTLAVSSDRGATWYLSTGLPSAGVPSIAVSPKSDDVVLVAWLDSATGTVTTYRSSDGGASFGQVGDAGWDNNHAGIFGGIFYSANARTPHVVVATQNGAYLSVDDGDHWQRIDSRTTSHKFTSARWMEGFLYLGTFGQGILRSDTRVD